MTSILLLAAIILGPALLLYFLKVNAVYVYLSLCLGEVLSFFLGTSTTANNLVINNQLLNSHFKSNNDIRLALLLIPAILTTAIMFRTVHSKKFSLNIVSSLSVGLLAVYLVVPLLNFDTSVGISGSKLWQKLILYQPEVIAATALYILVMIFMLRPKRGSHKAGKHS